MIGNTELRELEDFLLKLVDASAAKEGAIPLYVKNQYEINTDELVDYSFDWAQRVTRKLLMENMKQSVLDLLSGEYTSGWEEDLLSLLYGVGTNCYLHGVTMGLELHRRHCD